MAGPLILRPCFSLLKEKGFSLIRLGLIWDGCERVAFIFGSLLEGAKKMNIPTLIGEWGCYPHASEAQKEQARFLLNLFKENDIGNVYYDFSHIKDGGILDVLTTQ